MLLGENAPPLRRAELHFLGSGQFWREAATSLGKNIELDHKTLYHHPALCLRASLGATPTFTLPRIPYGPIPTSYGSHS